MSYFLLAVRLLIRKSRHRRIDARVASPDFTAKIESALKDFGFEPETAFLHARTVADDGEPRAERL
ncbi:MAG: hypothetical protein R3E51_21885, partial [Rhizobiaceae bacterium]